MRNGQHHIHWRKRSSHKKLEKYPHPHKGIRFLDKFLMVIAIVGPLMTLPQIWKIYSSHDATGVSTLTWSLYFFLGIPWLIYGIVHKEKPIIVAHILWLMVNLFVAIGALIY
jgi:MtN3 and saliva related transmembrane protein